MEQFEGVDDTQGAESGGIQGAKVMGGSVVAYESRVVRRRILKD